MRYWVDGNGERQYGWVVDRDVPGRLGTPRRAWRVYLASVRGASSMCSRMRFLAA
jgi:hypothetical protein